MRSPLLVLHIIAGTLGVLSGFLAVFLHKGSRQHGVVGNVFVISMLCLSSPSSLQNTFGDNGRTRVST
jgi:uncharacterized membrane protein